MALPPPLSAAALLDAAPVLRGRAAAEQGVFLASLGLPGRSFADCACLPIGARDMAIVGLRRAMFGERLDLSAQCPACGAPVDVTTSTAALLGLAQANPAAEPELEIDGARFAVRAAVSSDLAAIAGIEDEDEARAELALRCLVPLGGAAAPPWLEEAEVAAIGAALAAIDPAGDPFVALECAGCGAEWDAPIDIAAVLAEEIDGAAETLLDEVDAIARAYHWHEDAILALSQERRRAYIARVQP